MGAECNQIAFTKGLTRMGKFTVLAAAVVAAVAAFGLDNEAWLAKARENIAAGSMLDSDETPEDGVYCLVAAAIGSGAGGPEAQVGTATLEAKKMLTAYVHGETMTASTTLNRESASVSVDGEKTTKSFSRFRKKIESKVNAFVKGMKVVGQVTVEEKSYVVCVTTERFEDDSTILAAAQSEYGDEGVVKAVGEASTHELALQRAMRGAVEQVLGTVVVGYDKMSSDTGFKSKVFSGTDGVVEKYRVLSESEITVGKRIEIVAKVSKKGLLENYRNYMKFLGDPAFIIVSNSPDLSSHFTQFFTDMGIRITKNRSEARFEIQCYGDYRNVTNPMNGRKGVQLSLRFRIQETNGSQVLVDMKNDPKKSACFQTGGEDRQRELCSDKAFEQMRNPLHEKIQNMIATLVGQAMDAAAAD